MQIRRNPANPKTRAITHFLLWTCLLLGCEGQLVGPLAGDEPSAGADGGSLGKGVERGACEVKP